MNEFNEKLTHRFGYSPERRSRIIEAIRSRHVVIAPTNDLPTDCRDPDDNNVLQLAIFIKADFLITGDRDLLDLKQVGETLIISPRSFFEQYIP